jgi:hypothetical protein
VLQLLLGDLDVNVNYIIPKVEADLVHVVEGAVGDRDGGHGADLCLVFRRQDRLELLKGPGRYNIAPGSALLKYIWGPKIPRWPGGVERPLNF